MKVYKVLFIFRTYLGCLRNCTGKTSPLDCTLGSNSGESKHRKKVTKIMFKTWKMFNIILMNAKK